MLITVFLLVIAAAVVKWSNVINSKIPPLLPFVVSYYYMIRVYFNHDKLWPVMLALMKACEKAGGILSVYITPYRHILITEPDAAAVVLNTFFDKDDFIYGLTRDWLDNCLITAPAKLWKVQRKNLAITFNPRLLDTSTEKFNNQARSFSDSLSEFVGQPFDIFKHAGRNTVETMMITLFGLKELDSKEVMGYIEAVIKHIDILMTRTINFPLRYEFIFKMSRYKKGHDVTLKTLHNFSQKILDKRKSIRKTLPKRLVDDENNTYQTLPIDKLLDLEEKKLMDPEDVRNEIDIILYAGHDTSAGSVRIFLILLGTHHDVQDKVFNEITSVIPDSGDDFYVTKQQINQLKYFDAALKESMRLYPVVSAVGRKADRDIQIKNYRIPKGSSIGIMSYQIHRHAVWGADAKEFRPERWLEPGGVPSNPASFCAFSWGKRNCIGKAYGMLAMKIALVHILRRYKVYSDISNLRFEFSMLAKVTKGNLITLQPR